MKKLKKTVYECAIPSYKSPTKIDLPQCTRPNLNAVMEKYQELFCSIPGKTNEGYHVIPTISNPVKIPLRHIPAHYCTEVTQQFQTMLE